MSAPLPGSPGGLQTLPHSRPVPSPPRREGRRPVVEVLGAGATEVAGVLAESRLLGQPRQALDLIHVRRCLAWGRPGQEQQQQPRRRQRGSDHLQQEAGPSVSALPRSSALPRGGPVEELAARGQRSPRLGSSAHPPGPRVPSGLPGHPHLCSPASSLSRRGPVAGGHVESESRGCRPHVTVSPPGPRWSPGTGGSQAAACVRSESAVLPGRVARASHQMTQMWAARIPRPPGGPLSKPDG